MPLAFVGGGLLYVAITQNPAFQDALKNAIGPIWDSIAHWNENNGEEGESCSNPDGPNEDNLEDNVGKIAKITGLTEREVRDAIHDAKKYIPSGAKQKNPDVKIDVGTGEIYPKIPGGGLGDSIGNLYD